MAGAVKRIDERFPSFDLGRGFAASLIRAGEERKGVTRPQLQPAVPEKAPNMQVSPYEEEVS